MDLKPERWSVDQRNAVSGCLKMCANLAVQYEGNGSFEADRLRQLAKDIKNGNDSWMQSEGKRRFIANIVNHLRNG